MSTAVQKWGNSLGVRIPRDVARAAQLTEGSRVEIFVDAGRIVVKPLAVATLEELLARIPRGYRPELAEWGPRVGREVW